jgi:hypothetical protein
MQWFTIEHKRRGTLRTEIIFDLHVPLHCLHAAARRKLLGEDRREV